MKSLSKEKEYDEDAHQMTSQEVLPDIEEPPEQHVDQETTAQPCRFGSVLELNRARSPYDDAPPKPEVRTSVLRSFEYLRPLLQK